MNPDAVETFGEKSEWSVLQSIEYQSRGSALVEPVLRTVGDYEVLGVRGAAGLNLWIMLKPTSPPFYKQIPKGNYELSSELVASLEREKRLSYTVAQVLESHLARK